MSNRSDNGRRRVFYDDLFNTEKQRIKDKIDFYTNQKNLYEELLFSANSKIEKHKSQLKEVDYMLNKVNSIMDNERNKTI